MQKIIWILIFVLNVGLVKAQVGFVQEGFASSYGDEFEGRVTASGERFSQKKATCAHVSIPFGALVKITNLENNQTAVVRVNDRGPFVPDRIIDVSQSVAQKLGMLAKGVAKVRIEVVNNNGVAVADIPSTDPLTVKKNDNTVEEKVQPPMKKEGKLEPVQPEVLQKPQVEQPSVSNGDFYQVKVTSGSFSGYAVQIGSFRDLNNLLSLAADVSSKYGKSIAVQTMETSTGKVYRLLITGFSGKDDASNFKDANSKAFPGCFVVSL